MNSRNSAQFKKINRKVFFLTYISTPSNGSCRHISLHWIIALLIIHIVPPPFISLNLCEYWILIAKIDIKLYKSHLASRSVSILLSFWCCVVIGMYWNDTNWGFYVLELCDNDLLRFLIWFFTQSIASCPPAEAHLAHRSIHAFFAVHVRLLSCGEPFSWYRPRQLEKSSSSSEKLGHHLCGLIKQLIMLYRHELHHYPNRLSAISNFSASKSRKRKFPNIWLRNHKVQ